MHFSLPSAIASKPAKTVPRLTIQEHTDDVIAEAKQILDVFGYDDKYRRLTGQSLRDLVLRSCFYHDWGKAHPRWVEHLLAGRLKFAQLRHEMVSIDYIRRIGNHYLWPEEEVAILAHHGKLSYRHEHRWHDDAEDFSDLWRRMKSLDKRVSIGVEGALEHAVRQRYRFSTVRGLVQLADQRASQRERIDCVDPQPLHQYSYKFGYPTKRPLQKQALRMSDKMLCALRAETGSGKTQASLLWANEHVKAGNASRIVMALPTRFTATSLAQDVQDHIETGLYHSSAWYELEGEDQAADRLHDAQRFLNPLTVTTIDQVLMALTGRSEQHHLRFANLAHSALIIDEIDAYSDTVQANMQVLLRVLDLLDVPVFMMSATLPTSHLTGLVDEDVSEEVAFKDTTSAGSSFTLCDMQELDKDEFPTHLVEREDRVIVYANTVDRAVAYYEAISKVRDDVVLYHSRFTQPDRGRKEQKILGMLGKGQPGGVAVMTQVGEMSLNISSSIMISDLPPIDRLAQRTGRMCRFGGQHGELYLILPTKDGEFYPAPYGEYVRGSEGSNWIPASALIETRDRLVIGDDYDKIRLRDLAEDIYSDGLNISASAAANQKRYIDDEIVRNWLIVPKLAAQTDDTATSEWTTRSIPPQVDVFVQEPEDEYDTYRDFQRATLLYAVPTYTYRAKDLPTKTVQVKGEEKTVTYTTDYSPITGLV